MVCMAKFSIGELLKVKPFSYVINLPTYNIYKKMWFPAFHNWPYRTCMWYRTFKCKWQFVKKQKKKKKKKKTPKKNKQTKTKKKKKTKKHTHKKNTKQ